MSADSTIQLVYGDSVLAVRPGRLLDAILGAGFDHRHICGGNGFCTSCRIEVISGQENLSSVSPLERERLGRDAGRLRLACQTQLNGPAVIRSPAPQSSGFGPDDE